MLRCTSVHSPDSYNVVHLVGANLVLGLRLCTNITHSTDVPLLLTSFAIFLVSSPLPRISQGFVGVRIREQTSDQPET